MRLYEIASVVIFVRFQVGHSFTVAQTRICFSFSLLLVLNCIACSRIGFSGGYGEIIK